MMPLGVVAFDKKSSGIDPFSQGGSGTGGDIDPTFEISLVHSDDGRLCTTYFLLGTCNQKTLAFG